VHPAPPLGAAEQAATEPAFYRRDDNPGVAAPRRTQTAATEPAFYRRDDSAAGPPARPAAPRRNGARLLQAGRPIKPSKRASDLDMPQRSPPSTGGTTRTRGDPRSLVPTTRRNGARLLQAGRRTRAYYVTTPKLLPQRSPPSTGGTT